MWNDLEFFGNIFSMRIYSKWKSRGRATKGIHYRSNVSGKTCEKVQKKCDKSHIFLFFMLLRRIRTEQRQ